MANIVVTREQLQEWNTTADGEDALWSLGIDPQRVKERLEDLQARIFDVYRDGGDTIEVELT